MQLLPGTFEHALNHLLDHQLDLTGFDARFNNDATGAMAYPPAMLLKVILFAYSQGIISSRNIERACREHITFIARKKGSSLALRHFNTHKAYGTLPRRNTHLIQPTNHSVLILTLQHPRQQSRVAEHF